MPDDQAPYPEQPVPPREPFWGLRDLALFVGLAPVCLILGNTIVRAVLQFSGVEAPLREWIALPGQFVGYTLLFLALWLHFLTQYGRPFWRSLAMRWPSMPLPAMLAAGSVLALGVAMLGAALGTPEVESPMRSMLTDPRLRIWLILSGVTLGPLFEELAFRGLVQPVLVRRLGAASGILLPALAFGLLHLPQYSYSWRHGLLITCAGAAFGGMRHITGSTLASTIMHSAYNLTLFIGLLAGRDLA